MAFSYVYLLVSEANPSRHYVGLTDDIKDRSVAITPERFCTRQNIVRGD